MGIKKNILVDGKEVPFKASAAIPRLYRLKFGRDIYQDFAALQKAVKENEEQSEEETTNSLLRTDALELFENVAYIMAKHADPEGVPSEPDVWLEQFEMFSIHKILPQLMELWGLNMETQAQAKKTSPD